MEDEDKMKESIIQLDFLYQPNFIHFIFRISANKLIRTLWLYNTKRRSIIFHKSIVIKSTLFLYFTSNTFREKKKTKKTLISAEPVAFYLISLVFFLFCEICGEKVAEAEQENHISNVNNNILVCFSIDYISDICVFFSAAISHFVTNESDMYCFNAFTKQTIVVSLFCLLSINFKSSDANALCANHYKNADKMTKYKHD